MKFALPKNRFFKGSFMGQAKGRMQDGDEKVAENVFSVPFHGVDRSACPGARIGGFSVCLVAGSHPYILRSTARTEKPESGSRRVLF